MAVLAITYTDVTAPDFDGVDETSRHYVATLDGSSLKEAWVVATTAVDATVRTDFKAHLTAKGFTWTSEG